MVDIVKCAISSAQDVEQIGLKRQIVAASTNGEDEEGQEEGGRVREKNLSLSQGQQLDSEWIHQ